MLTLLLISSILFILACFIYAPVVHQYIIYKKSERIFYDELTKWDAAETNNLIVITKPLGLGPSQNSDVKFAKAHANYTFAINSVLPLLEELAED